MLRKQLECLPATLPQTYERILLNIDENYSQYALKILQWLTCSKSSLSLLELAEVVAIDEDEDPRFNPERRFPEPEDILLMCSSLVTTTEEKDDPFWNILRRARGEFVPEGVVKVRLAHFSVKEYLVSSQIMNGDAGKYSIQEIGANARIARDCLSYILYITDCARKPASHEEGRFWSDYPLAPYALREWQTHAKVGGQIDEEPMADLIMELFTPEGDDFRTWLFVDKYHNLCPPRGLPLYYVSENGILRVARRLSTMSVDVNAVSGYYGNALCVASVHGRTEMVKLLLKMGSDPNSRGRMGSALYWASYYGNNTIVRMLLDAGAEVGPEPEQKLPSGLNEAASIVTWMMSTGVDVNTSPEGALSFDNTALSVASSQGHDKVVKVLIEAGTNPDSRIAAMHLASRLGYDEVVKILLGAGADFNKGWQMASPLREAVQNHHLTTAEILLDAGADVKLGGSWSRDSWVPFGDHQEILMLLAAAGAEITSADETGLEDKTESEWETVSEGETETGDEIEPMNELP